MDLTEMTVDDADWIHLTANKSIAMTLVNTLMNILMSYETTNFFTNCTTISFSNRTLLREIGCMCPSCPHDNVRVPIRAYAT